MMMLMMMLYIHHTSTTTQAGLFHLLEGDARPPTRKEEAWRFTDLGKLYSKRHETAPAVLPMAQVCICMVWYFIKSSLYVYTSLSSSSSASLSHLLIHLSFFSLSPTPSPHDARSIIIIIIQMEEIKAKIAEHSLEVCAGQVFVFIDGVYRSDLSQTANVVGKTGGWKAGSIRDFQVSEWKGRDGDMTSVMDDD